MPIYTTYFNAITDQANNGAMSGDSVLREFISLS
jgi:hypothetical protein